MGKRVCEAIEELKKTMYEEGIDSTPGLPQDLFVFATTLFPCPNIDLFITRRDKLLLAWRENEFCGKGWHIPDGCLRLKETLEYRIQQIALNEIWLNVIYNKEHFITREVISLDYRPNSNN